MSTDTLIKLATPAQPGSPGTPDIPPSPAYCVTVPYTYPVYKRITLPGGGYVIVWDHNASGTYQLCYPATVGVPGIPAGYSTAADDNVGWNASADSVASLTTPGEYQFTTDGPSGIVTGLSVRPAGIFYPNIKFGIYCADGNYQIMESGVGKTAKASYLSTTVFTIAVVGGLVRYFKDSTLVYTSTVVNVDTTLVASACMYLAGDQIINAAFLPLGAAFAPSVATVAGILTPLTGFALGGGANLNGWEDNGKLGPLSGTATSWNSGTCAGLLTHITGQAFDSSFHEECSGILTRITGYIDAQLAVPDFTIVTGRLSHLSGFAVAVDGQAANVAGTLTRLTGFSLAGGANAGGWTDAGILTPITGVLATLPTGWFIGQLNDGGADSAYGLMAWGTVGYTGATGFNGTLTNHYTLKAFSGGLAYLTAPKSVPHYPITASATVVVFGEAVLTAPVNLPHYPILATGGQTIGRALLATNGRYKVVGQGGGTAILTAPVAAPHYLLTAHGFGGQLGEVVVALSRHHYIITASGTQNNYGSITGIITPLAAVWTGRTGTPAANQPRYQLLAYGHQPIALAYEAYAMTLDGDKDVALIGTTHYTNYPFDRILRFGTKYFGVAADGLYELSGNTFNGTAIVATVQTGETDMGEPGLKRTRRLYMAGRLTQNLQVSVIARENETDTYTYAPVLGGARNTRIPLGRGLQARYLAFAFQNSDGQDFELQEIGPEVDELRRTA